MSTAQAPCIGTIEITGLHGDRDVVVTLRPGLNIIYGHNGTGKTTLLHIIANLLNGDVDRFVYLRFDTIRVTFSSGEQVALSRHVGESGAAVNVIKDGELLETVSRDQAPSPAMRRTLQGLCQGQPVYLPAFRSVLEAVRRDSAMDARTERTARSFQRLVDSELAPPEGSQEPTALAARPYRIRARAETIAHKTLLCRSWFGEFVPVVRFPSLAETAELLAEEYQSAELQLAVRDRAAFSEVFVQVLDTVIRGASDAPPADTSATLVSIRRHLDSLQDRSVNASTVYGQLASLMGKQDAVPDAQEQVASQILSVYDLALQRRLEAQQDAFHQLKTFEDSVNRFLQGKQLRVGFVETRVADRRPAARVRWPGGREATLSVLSSGERHILTLLFSATHMPKALGTILIDEPELSLHVDWQRMILGELIRQVGHRQIVTCTHAPEVAAEHQDAIVDLVPHRPSEQLGFNAQIEPAQ